MENFLTAVSTTYNQKPDKEDSLFTLSSSKPTTAPSRPQAHKDLASAAEKHGAIRSLEDALETLKCQPEYYEVIAVLRYVNSSSKIHTHNAINSQICHVLVTEVAPNYWALLQEGSLEGQPSKDVMEFLLALQSLAGINALLSQLRALIQEAKAESQGPKRPDFALNFGVLLDILSALLKPDLFVSVLWKRISGVSNLTQRRILAQQLASTLGSGHIVQVTAEAESLAGRDRSVSSWVGGGKDYSLWLARNIVAWQKQNTAEDAKICSDLLSRSMRLGYQDTILTEVFERLLLSSDSKTEAFITLTKELPSADQRRISDSLLSFLANNRLQGVYSEDTLPNTQISAVTTLIRTLVANNGLRTEYLIAWLTSPSGAGLGSGISIRRAVIAAVSQDCEALNQMLEKLTIQFGDKLYIGHAPILQQEVHAQALILAGGYVFRQNPMKLRTMLRSSPYLQLVSNRLAASNARARILGMAIGEALSGLVDKENTLNFGMEETEADDVAWLKGLCYVSDEGGPIDSILQSPQAENNAANTMVSSQPVAKKKQLKKPTATIPNKVKPIIQEVDSESEDEDLQAYAKPDSDAEDSEEDATLVSRNKPKAPVYIRTLMEYFRDTESFDKQKLALANAALLIRRKANYGTEVSDHAVELATILAGMNDSFEIEEFYQQRLEGMIALVVAQPKIVGPILSRGVFEADYSLAQRASVLAAIGLGVRELAGIDNSKYAEAAQFPSKRLPQKIEKLYLDSAPTLGSASPLLISTEQTPSRPHGADLKALPPSSLDAIVRDLTESFIAPIAASAADTKNGPDALKLSTLRGTITRQNLSRPKVRSIPNTTASLIAASFFFPLTAHLQHAIHIRASVFSQHPFLLATAAKTLAILLHAAGPSTLALPQMTTELWDVLLMLRGTAATHINVAGALLTAFAALLEVNENRMRELCETHGRRVVETQEWAAGVFGGLRGGEGAGEENHVKMLAAAVLIRLREAVERYQALLMGDMGMI
ncbi:telomere length regulation protein [Ceratocystis lukuohia]|uniref:Telomere length regulation protein n=1 Tax=Ceratocystis lukuohia TaxID=2019550 RepID=A0ABR4MB05_9PEZI